MSPHRRGHLARWLAGAVLVVLVVVGIVLATRTPQEATQVQSPLQGKTAPAFTGDIYLTFDEVGGLGATSGGSAITNLPANSVAIGVVIEPLVAWLWAGGLLIGVGGLLALVPGSRRRATDPASAPAAMVTGAEPHVAEDDGTSAPEPQPQPEPEPVGALASGSAEPS